MSRKKHKMKEHEKRHIQHQEDRIPIIHMNGHVLYIKQAQDKISQTIQDLLAERGWTNRYAALQMVIEEEEESTQIRASEDDKMEERMERASEDDKMDERHEESRTQATAPEGDMLDNKHNRPEGLMGAPEGDMMDNKHGGPEGLLERREMARETIDTQHEDAKISVRAHIPVIRESWCEPARDWTVCFWNINGLRNALRKKTLRGFLHTFLPTILCLSEIKQRKDKLAKLGKRLTSLLSEFGYTSYIFNTCDNPNSGYAGTAILSQVRPERFIEGWAHDDKEKDTEGRVVTAIFKSNIIVNTYAASSGLAAAGNDFEQKRRTYEKNMRQHIAFLKSNYTQPIQLVGDLNICPTVYDVFDGKTNRDRGVWPACKEWERTLYKQLLRESGFVNVYDELYMVDARSTGHHTFWQTAWQRALGQGWRLDHTLATPSLLNARRGEAEGKPYIRGIDNLTSVHGSDHCPCMYILYNAAPNSPRIRTDMTEKMATCTAVEYEHVVQEAYEARLAAIVSMINEGTQTDTTSEDVKLNRPDTASEDAKHMKVKEATMDVREEEVLCKLRDAFNLLPALEEDLSDDEDVIRDAQEEERLQPLMTFLEKDGPLTSDDALFLRTEAYHSDRIEPDMQARLASIIEASVPFIEVDMAGKPVKTLCDSGASYSILSVPTLVRLYGMAWRTKLKAGVRCLPRFELADGSFTKAAGMIDMEMSIHSNGRTVRQPFYVINTNREQAILGVDFFIRAGAVMNFSRKTIRFDRLHGVGKKRFEIAREATLRGAVAPVYLMREITLQPGEEIDVRGRMAGNDQLMGLQATGFIERAGHGNRRNHLTLESVTKFKGRAEAATIRIVNRDTSASTLLPGALIGYFTPTYAVKIAREDNIEDYVPENEISCLMKRFDFTTFERTDLQGAKSKRASAHLGAMRQPRENKHDATAVDVQRTATQCSHDRANFSAECTICGYTLEGRSAREEQAMEKEEERIPRDSTARGRSGMNFGREWLQENIRRQPETNQTQQQPSTSEDVKQQQPSTSEDVKQQQPSTSEDVKQQQPSTSEDVKQQQPSTSEDVKQQQPNTSEDVNNSNQYI